VAKLNSVRILLCIAACKKWELYQLDVKNAFLHGSLEEEIYMDQPPGFKLEGETHKVCRLRKSLYGLKQSPRAWFARLSYIMISLGYVQTHSDHTVFVRRGENVCVLIVYVDDIIMTGDDVEEINRLKENLRSAFEIKDLGKLRYFLGIEVSRSEKGIFICQRKYTLDLLKETGMLGCKTVTSPIEPNHKLWDKTARPLEDPTVYKRLIGKLLYLTITRPDITYAASVLSKFLQNPSHEQLQAAYRVLKYLKREPGKRSFVFSWRCSKH
jgi:hypothetical protein